MAARIPFYQDPDLYRAQNFYLLGAALCMGLARLLPLARTTPEGPLLSLKAISELQHGGLWPIQVTAMGVSVIVAIYMLFDYRDLRQQRGSSLFLVVLNSFATGFALLFFAPWPYWSFALLPLTALLSLLAWRAVRRDMRRLAAADRLR